MNTAKKIVLPASKTFIVIGNICAGMLVVLKSDFFSKSVYDGEVQIFLCLWVLIFLTSFIRVSVSIKAIQILFLHLPIKTINKEKVACIEMVKWKKHTHILFETGNSLRYDISGFNSLTDYCMFNCFKVIDYKIPVGKEEYVVSLLGSMYDVHIADMSDKI